jgi:D-alanine-D-alanine ligase
MLYNVDPAWEPREADLAQVETDRLQAALEDVGHPVTPLPVQDANLAALLQHYSPDEFIVLNWCEGLPGVPHSFDQVAQTLEDFDFAYTGSTPEVLALSEDKRLVKQALDARGVPTPHWHIYDTARPNGWQQFPAIVKPALEHCSLGVTPEAVVLTPDELQRRIEYVLDTFRQPALVEEFIDGRELHVSLWGNGAIQMMPPAEMDFGAFDDVRDRLCTFSSKFDPASVHYNKIGLRLPAPLEDGEYQGLEHTARAAYAAVGCRDYARLDIRMQHGVFYVLDVNPNPDLCADSSLACAANVLGYSYGAMASRIVNLAAHRKPPQPA